MKRLVQILGGIGFGLVVTSYAQVRVALPVGGAAVGQSVLLPLHIEPSTNLAGVQCDILFDAARLACDGVQLVSGTTGAVVDGAPAVSGNPGSFRFLVYAPLGTALSNGVTCALAFRVLPEAPAGEVLLTADTNFVFGSTTASAIVSNQPAGGLVLIGAAFASGDVFTPVSSGTLWQFHAPTNSTWVTLASTNLITWQPLATNTVLSGVVFSFDAAARSFPYRFYRVTPQ